MGNYPGHLHAQGAHNHSHVVTFQQAMQRWGYGISADGWFGPITTAVTKDFQRWQGLAQDGIVGPLTWARA